MFIMRVMTVEQCSYDCSGFIISVLSKYLLDKLFYANYDFFRLQLGVQNVLLERGDKPEKGGGLIS